MADNFEKLVPGVPSSVNFYLLYTPLSTQRPRAAQEQQGVVGRILEKGLSVSDLIAMTTGHGFCQSPQPTALPGNRQWVFQV